MKLLKKLFGEEVITTQVITGQITPTPEVIDGKRVYVKRINVSPLPNQSENQYAHGLTNATIVYAIGAVTSRTSGSNLYPIPFIHASDATLNIQLYWDNTYIKIATASDRSQLNGYVNIYFIYND